MEQIWQGLVADWNAFLAFLPNLVYAAVVLAAFVLIGRAAGPFIARAVRDNTDFKTHDRLIRQVLRWGISLLGLLAALGVLGLTGTVVSILATGGIAAIVLGFAFREIGENFLAGLFLSFSRPFEIGDLVQSGGLQGVVQEISLRHVQVRAPDGCDYYIPSTQIFREPLLNFTRDGLRRADFSIGIAYEDEPERVLALLREAAAGEPAILHDPAPVVSVAQFDASYVVYQVFFWVDVDASNFTGAQNGVKMRCWRALQSAGMTFSANTSTSVDVGVLPPVQLSSHQDTD